MPSDVDAYVNNNSFQALRVNNLDEDDVLDIWSINEMCEINYLVNDYKYQTWSEYEEEKLK